MIGKPYPKKLEDKLEPFERGFLRALDVLIDSQLECFFDLYIDDLDTGPSTLDKIKAEIAQDIFDYVQEYLESYRDEAQIAFIESNHYSIDEEGNVVDDNEPEKPKKKIIVINAVEKEDK